MEQREEADRSSRNDLTLSAIVDCILLYPLAPRLLCCIVREMLT
jgi:hypothetical protein